MDSFELQGAWTVEDFARRHALSRSTVYQEINAGRLVARKVRGRTVITFEDAKVWRENLPKMVPANER